VLKIGATRVKNKGNKMDPRFFRKYLDIMNERVVIGPDGKPLPGIGSIPAPPAPGLGASGLTNPNTTATAKPTRSPEEEEERRQAQQDVADTLKARDAGIDAENQALSQQGQTRSFRPLK